MQCKYGPCTVELPEKQPGGHRQRLFCSDAHRQAWHRQQKQQPGQAASDSQELEEARARIADLAQEVSDLEQENTRLRNELDVETRFLSDRGSHGFIHWLRRQSLQTPIAKKILTDSLIPPQGSRGTYQQRLRTNGYSQDEIEQFRDLWRLMLMQS